MHVLGISLKSQELTAIFLTARLFCSYIMESDIHTLLDFSTLLSTLWVIYMIRFKLKSTYTSKLDGMPLYYVVNEDFSALFFSHLFHALMVVLKKKEFKWCCIRQVKELNCNLDSLKYWYFLPLFNRWHRLQFLPSSSILIPNIHVLLECFGHLQCIWNLYQFCRNFG